MPTGNPIDVMLAHDRWATANMLAAAAGLTDEQLAKPFEIGPGSLIATLTHLLGTVRRWTDMLTGQEPPRPRLEDTPHSIAELTALHPGIADEFEAIVRAHPPEALATASKNGRTVSFARGAVLTHVATHGMHHRAQILNMMRHVGVDPLPKSSVLDWMIEVDLAR